LQFRVASFILIAKEGPSFNLMITTDFLLRRGWRVRRSRSPLVGKPVR
jgi:hypothetical protein